MNSSSDSNRKFDMNLLKIDSSAQISLNHFENLSILQSFISKKDEKYFDICLDVLEEVSRNSSSKNSLNDQSKSTSIFELSIIKMIYMRLNNDQKQELPNTILTVETFNRLHRLFLLDSEVAYQRSQDSFVRYTIASKWFIATLIFTEALEKSSHNDVYNTFIDLLSKVQNNQLSAHLELLKCILIVTHPNIEVNKLSEESKNVRMSFLIQYIESMLNQYAINEDIKHLMDLTMCKILTRISEKIIFDDKSLFRSVICMIGNCLKSPEAYRFVESNSEELTNMKCFIDASFKQFPYVDSLIYTFLSNYSSNLEALDFSKGKKLSFINTESLIYNLKIEVEDENFKYLRRINDNTIIVRQNFTIQGQFFPKNLVGYIKALSDDQLLISFDLSDTLVILMSYICYAMNNGELTDSVLVLTCLSVKLIHYFSSSRINSDNFENYKILVTEILTILLTNTHSIAQNDNSRQLIQDIYTFYAKFASDSQIKSILRNLFTFPQNKITIYSIICLISEINHVEDINVEDINFFVTTALTNFNIFEAESKDEAKIITNLISNFSHLMSKSTNILQSFELDSRIITFLVENSFMTATKIIENLINFGTLNLSKSDNALVSFVSNCQECLGDMISLLYDSNKLDIILKILRGKNINLLIEIMCEIILKLPIYSLRISTLRFFSKCMLLEGFSKIFVENSMFDNKRFEILLFMTTNLHENMTEEIQCITSDFFLNILKKSCHGNVSKLINDFNRIDKMYINTLLKLLLPSHKSSNIYGYSSLLKICSSKFPPKLLDWDMMQDDFVSAFMDFITCDDEFNPQALFDYLELFHVYSSMNKKIIDSMKQKFAQSNSLLKFVGKIFVMIQGYQYEIFHSQEKLQTIFRKFLLLFEFEYSINSDTTQLGHTFTKLLKICHNVLEKQQYVKRYIPFIISISEFALINHKFFNILYLFDQMVENFKMLFDVDSKVTEKYCAFFTFLLQQDNSLINGRQDMIMSMADLITRSLGNDHLYRSQFFIFIALVVSLLPGRAVQVCLRRFGLMKKIETNFIRMLTCTKDHNLEDRNAILLSIMLLIKSLASHDSFLIEENTSMIFRMIMLPLDDFFKNNKNDCFIVSLFELSCSVAHLASVGDIFEKYKKIGNFIACHRQMIIHNLKQINFSSQENLRLCISIAKILENMLNIEYNRCQNEFKDIIDCFKDFPSLINSHINGSYLNRKMENKASSDRFEGLILELSNSIVLLIYSKTPNLISLLSKEKFSSNDLFLFSLRNYSADISLWIRFSQSLALLASNLEDSVKKMDIYPLTKHCLELMCLILISQLFMIQKIFEQESPESSATTSSEFILQISSPLKSPRRSNKIGIASAITLDTQSIGHIERALAHAFKEV
ncbi:MAG: hypothetical protein MHMPM18_002190 [Marteilia pararefringens]